ncbi:hypothetical protein ACLOJK_019704 [Asimina triloba]
MRDREREKESLRYQLSSIQMEVQSLSPQTAYSNFPWSGQPLYTPNIQPQPLFPSYSAPQVRSSNPLAQPVTQQWRPKPTITSGLVITEPISVPLVAPAPATSMDKGKKPMMPIPEYIPELSGGASARLPEDIFPIEELNPISSFLRVTALREIDPESSEEENESVYMADPGPSVQHPDEPTPMQQDIPKPSIKPEQFTIEKDLEKHYTGMSARYYLLGGLDDTNIKQVYLNSLPPPLGDDTKRYLAGKNQKLQSTTLGELYTQSLITLDRLCNQKAFLESMQNLGTGFTKFCERPDLSTKCKTEKVCKCLTHPNKKKPPKFFKRKKKKFRFFKKKPQRGKTSTLCFLFKKSGHYAKDCPNRVKKKKVFKQASILLAQEAFSDLESVLTEEEAPTVDTLLFFSDTSEDESSESEAMYTIQNPGPNTVQNPEHWPIESLTIPVATVSVYPTKYDKPIRVEALFDTGAAATMAHTSILPKDCWKPYHRVFKAANGESFEVNQISHLVTIQIFPTVSMRHQIIGADIIGKPLIIGFDILQKLKLQWSNNGLHHRQQILPWNSAPIFIIDSSSQSYEQVKQAIINTNGAESHTEFLSKCDNPLWKNPEFFINLPFKMNEDINPTKAIHPGMSPTHYDMARQELQQLEDEALIEPTSSAWA